MHSKNKRLASIVECRLREKKGQHVSQWFERFQAAKAAAVRVSPCPHTTPGWTDGQQTCTACGEVFDEPGSEHCPPEASARSVLSEKPRLRLLTQPTKAPSVSAPGHHVLKNAQEEDPPAQYWSDVLHERFWVAPTAAHAAALSAQGQVAYQPDEIWRLRDLTVREPQTFAAKLCAIHQAKQTFEAVFDTREQAVAPGVLPLFQRAPGTCYACGTTRRWRSHYGAVVCARCHSPADAALVAGWAGEA
jgi:hypothetical protein